MVKFVDGLARMAGALVVLLGGTAFLLYALLSVLRDLLVRYEAPDAAGDEPPTQAPECAGQDSARESMTASVSASLSDSGQPTDAPVYPAKRKVA